MRSGSIHFFLQHIYLKKTNLIISGQDITGDYMSSASDNILHTQPLSLVIDQWFASFSDISREHFFVGVKEFFLSVGEICGEHLLVFGGDLQDLGRCRAASSASRPPPRNAGCHWDLQAFLFYRYLFSFFSFKLIDWSDVHCPGDVRQLCALFIFPLTSYLGELARLSEFNMTVR